MSKQPARQRAATTAVRPPNNIRPSQSLKLSSSTNRNNNTDSTRTASTSSHLPLDLTASLSGGGFIPVDDHRHDGSSAGKQTPRTRAGYAVRTGAGGPPTPPESLTESDGIRTSRTATASDDRISGTQVKQLNTQRQRGWSNIFTSRNNSTNNKLGQRQRTNTMMVSSTRIRRGEVSTASAAAQKGDEVVQGDADDALGRLCEWFYSDCQHQTSELSALIAHNTKQLDSLDKLEEIHFRKIDKGSADLRRRIDLCEKRVRKMIHSLKQEQEQPGVVPVIPYAGAASTDITDLTTLMSSVDSVLTAFPKTFQKKIEKK
eukprot:PhM_4_TR6164/c0_g1_i1/m.104907